MLFSEVTMAETRREKNGKKRGRIVVKIHTDKEKNG